MTDWTRKTEMQILLGKLKEQCDTNGRDFGLIVSLIVSTGNPQRIQNNYGWLTVNCDGHEINIHASKFSHGDLSVPRKAGKLAVTNYSYAASVALKYTELKPYLKRGGNLEAARRQIGDELSFMCERQTRFLGDY